MALVQKHELPFQRQNLEEIILMICDKFDIRVVIRDEDTLAASIMTTGLALVGGFLGHLLAGKMGAIAGATAGGACAVGIVAVSMRELWEEIKQKLSELFNLVHAYLAELDIYDNVHIIRYLMEDIGCCKRIAWLIVETVNEIIGKRIISSITAA